MAEPKVRFKQDNGNSYPYWEGRKLGELATFSKGQGYSKSDLKETGTSIILYGRLYTKYQTVINSVDTFAVMKPNSVLSEKGDIVIPASGETPEDISVASVVNISGVILGGDLNVVRVCKNIKPEYLAYLLTFGSPHYEMARFAQGKSIVHLHNDDLKKASIFYPCLEEQQKIVDFLSSVDEVIFTSEQEVANLETQKKAVMKKIFSQEVRFKKDDGSNFPEWKEKSIREFAQCVAGATPSTMVEDYWKNGTIPWMSSGEVNKGLIFDTDAKITQLGYDNTTTKMVPAETVVMALAGQGKTRGMVALTKIELCTNQSLCSIISDSSVCSAYLYQYLITQYQNLRQASSGDGTRGGLNLQLVGNYTVLIPCLDEQKLIADFLSNFDEAILSAKKELELWKELKRGLLQQMFV